MAGDITVEGTADVTQGTCGISEALPSGSTRFDLTAPTIVTGESNSCIITDVEPSNTITVTPNSCPVTNIESPIIVTANIERWTSCSDDIYLLRFHEAPPGWLEDTINNIVDETNLASDLNDLDDRFSNFEEGYTAHFYDWKDGDVETLTYVENIYTTNAVYNAGIQEIKIAYVSKNESGAYFDSLIGAWQTGQGGAWFNEQVSVVSNVAYSAAISASTLTATMQSQQDNISVIAGDIEILKKQIDGQVVTWFVANGDNSDGKPYDTVGPVNPDGSINEDGRPYYCWLPGNVCPEDIYNDDTVSDTRADHTGDTYVYFEYDAFGNKRIISTWRFGKDPYSDEYNWFIFTDDLATTAYQASIDAQVTADSKITTYFQDTPPTLISNPELGEGDIWVDSLHENMLYRFNGTSWTLVRDTAITASVDRLDEATVDINGIATAKSALVVDANGNISGYVANASTDPSYSGSQFRIFADEFLLANTAGQPAAYAPFYVNTVTNSIRFNGDVLFENIREADGTIPDWVFSHTLTDEIDRNVTTINGGKITTGYIDAKYLGVDTVWTRGMIVSSDYNGSSTGYIGAWNPTGFMLNATAGAGSYNEPNIYGSYIRGGSIYGTHIMAVTMDTVTLNAATINTSVLNAAILNAPSINGMKFKMGCFKDNNYDYNINVNINNQEGVVINKYGTTISQKNKTSNFSVLMGVMVSLVGPSTNTLSMQNNIIVDSSNFLFDRENDYDGPQVWSFIAFGY